MTNIKQIGVLHPGLQKEKVVRVIAPFSNWSMNYMRLRSGLQKSIHVRGKNTVVIQLSGWCGTGESEKCPDNQKIRIIENIIKHPLAL